MKSHLLTKKALFASCEIIKPIRYDEPMDLFGILLYGGLSAIFALLTGAWLHYLGPRAFRRTKR